MSAPTPTACFLAITAALTTGCAAGPDPAEVPGVYRLDNPRTIAAWDELYPDTIDAEREIAVAWLGALRQEIVLAADHGCRISTALEGPRPEDRNIAVGTWNLTDDTITMVVDSGGHALTTTARLEDTTLYLEAGGEDGRLVFVFERVAKPTRGDPRR